LLAASLTLYIKKQQTFNIWNKKWGLNPVKDVDWSFWFLIQNDAIYRLVFGILLAVWVYKLYMAIILS